MSKDSTAVRSSRKYSKKRLQDNIWLGGGVK